jgi:hypothetical protein
MARLRASFVSFTVLRSSASMLRLAEGETAFSTLQAGQRLAKPGLSGLSSNSSEQTAQIRRGKAIPANILQGMRAAGRGAFRGRPPLALRNLSAGGSGGLRGWRKVAHGDVIPKLRNSTVARQAALDHGSVCEYPHRNVVCDVIHFITAYLHPLKRGARVPGLLSG